jgi:hypothetical protein
MENKKKFMTLHKTLKNINKSKNSIFNIERDSYINGCIDRNGIIIYNVQLRKYYDIESVILKKINFTKKSDKFISNVKNCDLNYSVFQIERSGFRARLL